MQITHRGTVMVFSGRFIFLLVLLLFSSSPRVHPFLTGSRITSGVEGGMPTTVSRSTLAYTSPAGMDGQLPFAKQYTAENGLPSSEILDLCQDHQGYIWFVTAFGLARFDGRGFKEFTTTEGLPSLSGTKAFLSPGGQAWFSSYEASLSYATPTGIKAILHNETFSRAMLKSPLLNLVWMTDGSLVGKSAKNLSSVKLSAKGIVEVFDRDFSFPDNADLYILPYHKALIWGMRAGESPASPTGVMPEKHPRDPAPPGLQFYSLSDDLKIKMPHKSMDYSLKLLYCFVKEGLWYIGIRQHLFLFSGGKLTRLRSFPASINHLFFDKNGQLWISLTGMGVMVFEPSRFQTESSTYLNGCTVSAMLQDHQGGYWFATLEKGAFYVPGFDFKVYSQLHPWLGEPVQALLARDRQLLVSTMNGHSFFFQPLELSEDKQFFVNTLNINRLITEFSVSGDGTTYIAGNPMLKLSPAGEIHLIPRSHAAFTYSLLQGPDEQLWAVCDYGIYLYRNGEAQGLQWEFQAGVHPRVMGLDSSGRLWAGTFQGLYELHGDHTYTASPHPLLHTRITCIACTRPCTWLGSRSEGVIRVNQDTITRFSLSDGLLSNSINAILPLGDSALWVATNKGLNQICLQAGTSRAEVVRSYTIWQGLPAGEIKRIARLGKHLWLATNQGLVSFEIPTKPQKEIPPPILSFEKIVLNDSIALDSTAQVFRHDQATFSFFYKGISFKHADELTYRYTLRSSDSNWIITANPSLRFPDLPPGDYRFRLQARIPASDWSEPPLVYAFTIREPFTATLWFYALVLLTSLLALGALFLVIFLNYKRKSATQKAMLMAEIKALRSQMNPHFIFNSLNSIQYFMLGKSHEHANYYLSGFAKLMRRILEQSAHNLIPLKEELDTIHLYLELEQMRFDHAFDYVEQIDPSVDQEEVRIPPMLLQPFLENAIWHGLMPREESGVLCLKIVPEPGKSLRIIIEDNGVGRAFKPAGNCLGHQATGMKNINDRITLFNKINRSNIQLFIEDLFTSEQKAAGTRIVLDIPENIIA